MKPDSAPSHPFFISFLFSAIIHCLGLVVFVVVLTTAGTGQIIPVNLVDRSVSSQMLKVYTDRVSSAQEMPFVIPFENFGGTQKGELCLSGANSFRIWQDMPAPESERYFSPRAASDPKVPATGTADIFLLERYVPEPAPVDRSAGMEINFLHYRMRHVVSGQERIGGLIGEETVVAVLYVDSYGNVVSSFIENSSGNGAVDDSTMQICRGLRFDQMGPQPDPYDVQAMKITFRMDAAACARFASEAAAAAAGAAASVSAAGGRGGGL